LLTEKNQLAGTGGVVQVVEQNQEFKPQYRQQKTKKSTHRKIFLA
jgi:hypothetical protein